jgi:hypothetical protein
MRRVAGEATTTRALEDPLGPAGSGGSNAASKFLDVVAESPLPNVEDEGRPVEVDVVAVTARFILVIDLDVDAERASNEVTIPGAIVVIE